MKNKNKNRVFRFNRRVRKLTDYQQRLRFLKSKLTRIVIRASNKNIIAAFTDYEVSGDKIICSANSCELKNFKYDLPKGNTSSAYLTGFLAGKKYLKTKNELCIIDFGLAKVQKGSKLFAVVKGLVDAKVQVKTKDEMFPNENRIFGEHLKTKNAKEKIESTIKLIEEKQK